MKLLGWMKVAGIRYDVWEAFGTHPDLVDDHEGRFIPLESKILIREGARRGSYEHEEEHAIWEASGLSVLIECDVSPAEKREEAFVSILTNIRRTVERSPELQEWLRSL